MRDLDPGRYLLRDQIYGVSSLSQSDYLPGEGANEPPLATSDRQGPTLRSTSSDVSMDWRALVVGAGLQCQLDGAAGVGSGRERGELRATKVNQERDIFLLRIRS